MSEILIEATLDTIYMIVGSTFFSVILGFIPAIIMTLTASDGLRPNKVVYGIFDFLT